MDSESKQGAQIKRMRAALEVARASLATTLYETERVSNLLAGSDFIESKEAAAVIDEYRSAILAIDEALGELHDR